MQLQKENLQKTHKNQINRIFNCLEKHKNQLKFFFVRMQMMETVPIIPLNLISHSALIVHNLNCCHTNLKSMMASKKKIGIRPLKYFISHSFYLAIWSVGLFGLLLLWLLSLLFAQQILCIRYYLLIKFIKQTYKPINPINATITQ